MKQPTATSLDDWITTAEAAIVMGITQRHVTRLVISGEVKGRLMTDRLTLVNKKSAEAWKPKRIRKEKDRE